MGSGVVALVVARDREAPYDSVLRAAAAQTLRPDALLLLDCSADSSLNPADAGPVRIIRTPGAANLGEAIRSIRDSDPDLGAARWWWILHDDSVPEPACLRALWEAADRGRTIGFVGAKQMSPDGAHLLEFGIRATRTARRLERVNPGEIDQGQYDSTSDVLAAGTAGALVSPAAWDAVGGPDPMLGPFGDGLDFGRRLHLAGFRVVVAPEARVRHSRLSLLPADGGCRPAADEPRDQPRVPDPASAPPAVADGPGSTPVRREPEDASFAPRRFAQIYNWAKAAPAPALPLLMAWLAIWSPARALARLLSGAPHLARPELSAWARTVAATPALLSARRLQARTSTVPAKALRGLEASGRELRERRRELAKAGATDGGGADPLVLDSLRAHRARSRSTLLLVMTVALLLAAARWWGMDGPLAGGAWRALPATGGGLWEAAWSTWIPGGDGGAGPADPLLIPLALLGAPLSLLGLTPSGLARLLLFASGPLAALSAWRFASRLTASPGLRGASALAWAVLPALSLSQTQGRLAPALFHVLLPLAASAWISLIGASPVKAEGAHGPVDAPAGARSGALARFALLGAGLVACTPWAILPLLPALALLRRRGASTAGVLAALLPALLIAGPTLVAALRLRAWRALLGPSGPDAANTPPPGWQEILGIPTRISHPEVLALALLPGALLLLTALLSLLLAARSKAEPRSLLLVCSALALAGGAAVSRLDVGLDGSQVLSAWPAPALSLGALGLLGIILRAAPASQAWNSATMRRIGSFSALASLLLIAGGAAPILERLLDADAVAGMTISQRLASTGITEAPDLIPAVSAQAQASGRAGRILLLDSDAAVDALDARLWRGEGPSILDSTPISRAQDLRAALNGEDADPARTELGELALTLVVYPDEATVRRLADHGVDTILIRPDSAGLERMSDALDRAPGLERVGDTAAGALWRLRLDDLQPARARILDGGTWTNLESGLIRADGSLAEATRGTILLAERYDPGWTATLDSRPLEASPRGWAQSFTLDGGPGELLITHETRWGPPWRILALSALALTALAAIPWRRRP